MTDLDERTKLIIERLNMHTHNASDDLTCIGFAADLESGRVVVMPKDEWAPGTLRTWLSYHRAHILEDGCAGEKCPKDDCGGDLKFDLGMEGCFCTKCSYYDGVK